MDKINGHTPTPWYALSGGYISTSVTADWANNTKYVGMAATDKDAQKIVLAHNEAVRAISSEHEKRSEAHVNSYEPMREALELLTSVDVTTCGPKYLAMAMAKAGDALALATGTEQVK